MLLSAAERVELLERAFYRDGHDRERMAALLNKAADLILTEYQQGVPNDMSRVRHLELMRVARHLRQYGQELMSAEPND